MHVNLHFVGLYIQQQKYNHAAITSFYIAQIVTQLLYSGQTAHVIKMLVIP